MIKKKTKKEKAKKDSSAETVHNGIHKNIRCRNCLIVDGYPEREKVCRYCGARLSIEQ